MLITTKLFIYFPNAAYAETQFADFVGSINFNNLLKSL